MFISGYLILELNSSREEDKPNLEWENNVSRGGVGSLTRVTKKVGVIQLCLFQEQCVQHVGQALKMLIHYQRTALLARSHIYTTS